MRQEVSEHTWVQVSHNTGRHGRVAEHQLGGGSEQCRSLGADRRRQARRRRSYGKKSVRQRN